MRHGAEEPLELGKLWVESLPRGAWEEWCKEGRNVVCFAFSGPEVLKIYFADPETLSVYHVTDFWYFKFGRDWRVDMYNLGCTMVGSKLYVLGGSRRDVYYFDVAKNLTTDGYNWERGPDLNTLKKKAPLVFSLANSIYALSVGGGTDAPAPFEVLKSRKKKSVHKKKWKVLEKVPKFVEVKGIGVLGSFVYEDGNQFLLLVHYGSQKILCTYNGESKSWVEKKVDSCSIDDLPTKDLDLLFLGKSFVINGFRCATHSDLLGALGFNLEEVEELLLPSKEQEEEYLRSRDIHDLATYRGQPHPESWHIVPLIRGKNNFRGNNNKLCLLAFYDDTYLPKCYVRFATFDLVKLKKRRRFASKPKNVAKIENCAVESIAIAEEEQNGLMPYTMVCSQVVSIPK